jgi:protein gp37
MGENTAIEWADHTLNWWTGCEAISPGCEHCYAATWAKRAGRVFSERRLTSASIHALPAKWQREAAEFRKLHGRRQRVFVNSLADWADNQVPQDWRISLLRAIREAPDVDFLLLTKRIGNVHRMLERALTDGHMLTSRDSAWPWPNIWIGISVVNQEEADRDIPKLLDLPAAVRFLSCEPLLDELRLQRYLDVDQPLDWVIVGGESGPGARAFNLKWARDIARQCKLFGTACFVKQLGANPIYQAGRSVKSEGPGFRLSVTELQIDTDIALIDRKGGDWSEWPPDLRIREFPRSAA